MHKNRAELAAELYQDILALVTAASERPVEQFFENSLRRTLCSAAIRFIANDGGSPEARSMAHWLGRRGLLSASLADTSLCRTEEAVQAAQTALDAGLPLQSCLAEELSGALKQAPAFETISKILRILDILAALSDGFDLSRLELLAYPDKKVQSRAALLIGRAIKNPILLSHCFNDSDARVQASAVEAMWDMPADRARPLLIAAAKSANNRVAANALVGLYHHGDDSAICSLFQMAQRPDLSFRLSAVWAMGKTGDARFLPFLTELFKDSRGKLRLAATRALSQIRRREKLDAVDSPDDGPPLHWPADPD